MHIADNKAKHVFVRTDDPNNLQDLFNSFPDLEKYRHILTSSFQNRIQASDISTGQKIRYNLGRFLRHTPGCKGLDKAFCKDIWQILDDSRLIFTEPKYPSQKERVKMSECKQLKDSLAQHNLLLMPLEKRPHHALIM